MGNMLALGTTYKKCVDFFFTFFNIEAMEEDKTGSMMHNVIKH
jgi:hypothetical protein